MPDARLTADAAIARLQRIMNRWPRPQAGEGVRADAVLAAMLPLVPIARQVLTLPEGYRKGYYPGAGYLSVSPTIQTGDLALAEGVLRAVYQTLPIAGELQLNRDLYGGFKASTYRLLALATDLDVTEASLDKVGAASTSAWDSYVSLHPSVGTDAGTGAKDASKLTDDMIALKHVVEIKGNYDQIVATDPSFVPSFDAMLQGWNRFLQNVAGKNVSWYNIPGKIVASLSAAYLDSTANYNTVQDYQKKFNDHYARVQEILKKQPTPSMPAPPKPRKEDKPLLDNALETLVKGALIIGGAAAGVLVLGSVLRR